MIAVINYGMGNAGSILNMLKKIGAEAIITDKIEEINNADKIILPGVGTFDNGMSNLHDLGLVEVIKTEILEKKKPFLGICLGMQLLGRRSEEGQMEGLNLIPFETKKFSFDSSLNLKIPHMGWNIVKFNMDDPLFINIEGTQRYYFVHSYHAVCDSSENSLISCNYGYEFTAAVKKDNVYGVQFHPEKSHKFGMKLLENFVGGR